MSEPIGRGKLQELVDDLLQQEPPPNLNDYWNGPSRRMLRGSQHIGVSWDLTTDPEGVYLYVRHNPDAHYEDAAVITPSLARDIAVSLLHMANKIERRQGTA